MNTEQRGVYFSELSRKEEAGGGDLTEDNLEETLDEEKSKNELKRMPHFTFMKEVSYFYLLVPLLLLI